MKLRRLLFAALLAICFDAAVPFEPAAHGALVWEDEEEAAVRAEQRREPAADAQRTPSPRRDAETTRARLAARRAAGRVPPGVRLPRLIRAATPPSRPSPAEDH